MTWKKSTATAATFLAVATAGLTATAGVASAQPLSNAPAAIHLASHHHHGDDGGEVGLLTGVAQGAGGLLHGVGHALGALLRGLI
jgi:hypothetical protein